MVGRGDAAEIEEALELEVEVVVLPLLLPTEFQPFPFLVSDGLITNAAAAADGETATGLLDVGALSVGLVRFPQNGERTPCQAAESVAAVFAVVVPAAAVVDFADLDGAEEWEISVPLQIEGLALIVANRDAVECLGVVATQDVVECQNAAEY